MYGPSVEDGHHVASCELSTSAMHGPSPKYRPSYCMAVLGLFFFQKKLGVLSG